MAEKRGSAIPIWFSPDERQRLEEAAALSGYKHLSTYIKDRLFDHNGTVHRRDVVDSQAGSEVDLETRMDLLLADQAILKSMLAFLTLALSRSESPSERQSLARQMSSFRSEADLFQSLGDLGQVLEQFSKELE